MESLIARLRRTGFVIFVGIILIIFIGLGIIYVQQGQQQKNYRQQIAQLEAVLSRPLPSDENLRIKYDEVKQALVPMTDSDAIAILVSIAEKSGIDISKDRGKFTVPSVTTSKAQVGGGNYQILSFTGMHVQGNYDNVMAYIADLDSGKTLETMVLKNVEITRTETETSATLQVDIYTTKPAGGG